jgi:hypothetical protein
MGKPLTRSRILFLVALAICFVLFQGYIHGISARWLKNWNEDLRRAQASISQSQTSYDRFLALTHAQIPALECGKNELAKAYASEALQLAPQFKQDWNYGNAIHNGHVVLGRLALIRGDVESASKELLLAGKTPGSPQLDSFGPNMSLAKELLDHGQRDVVLQYFDECQVFWRSDFGALKKWRMLVRLHLPPDFGVNLVH